jgi:hypothetical protein
MRHRRRRRAIKVVLLALLLLAPVAVAIVAWRFAGPALLGSRPRAAYFIASERGSVRLWSQEVSVVPPPPPADVRIAVAEPGVVEVYFSQGAAPWTGVTSNLAPATTSSGFAGVRWGGEVLARGYGIPAGNTSYHFIARSRSVHLSWALIITIASLPALVLLLLRYRRRRLIARGRCAECGYDLRATPDRCPECGALAAVTSSPQSRRTPRESAFARLRSA